MTLVIVGRSGRLGNRIWTYANVLSFALRHRLQLVSTAFLPWKNYFDAGCQSACNVTAITGVASRSSQLWHSVKLGAYHSSYRLNLRARVFPSIDVGESDLLDLDEESDWFLRQRLVFLSGFHLASPSSLERHADAVRQFFKPSEDIRSPADCLVQSLRIDNDVVIGVHVRHGDYRTYCSGTVYYSVDEYSAVMHCLVEQLPGRRVAFVICSDEPQDPAAFRSLNVHIGPGTALGDMYALSQCDFIFGPNSSFSHWASFWGEVPLHVLEWKAARAAGHSSIVTQPSVERDFHVFTARRFGSHSRRRVNVREALR